MSSSSASGNMKCGKTLPCICSVCGDGASEHLHYGAICCFSCRAFFRRYADREKCVCVRGDSNCVIDTTRRNDCMYCRLKKCYTIGMKKDYVRGPNQSLRRKREEEGFKGRKPVSYKKAAVVESSIKPSRGFPKDSGATCDDKQQHASRRDNNYLKSQHQVRLDLLKQHRKRPHPDEVDDFQPRRLVVDQPKQAKSLDVPPDADLSLYYRTQLPSGSSPPFASSSSSSSRRTLEPPLRPYVKLEELDEPPLIKSPEQKQLLPQPQVDRYYRHTSYPLPPLKRCESPMQDSHLRSFSCTRQHQWREIFSPHMPGAKNSPPLSPDQAAPISKYRQDQENQAEISCQPQYDSFYEHEQTHKEPPKYFDSQRGHHTLYRHEPLLQRNASQQPHDYQEEHQLSQWQYSVRASPTLYPLGTARAPSTSSSFDESGLSDFSDGILLKGSFLSKPPTIMSAQTSRKWIEEDIMSNSSSKSGQGCSLTPSENWSPEPSNSWHENPNGNMEAPIDYSMRNTAAAPYRDQEGKNLMHGQKQASLEEMFVGKERMDMKDNFSPGTFTNEELQLIDYVQKSRAHIIGKISDAYYDDTYREELTALLVSRGSIRPSFQFLETINKSIMESSVEVIKDILDLFNIAESLQRLLLAENVSFTCLVGSAVNIYGNNAQTFAEQAELSGIVSSKYVQWLEENNLTDIVPRLEIHYLNPSPWSEQEVSEVEFHDVLKKIGEHVGTDQLLACLLIMVNLFSLEDSSLSLLSVKDQDEIRSSNERVTLLLKKYLRAKLGPKKASSKFHHHFELIKRLKSVSKNYREKKLSLVSGDQASDISNKTDEEEASNSSDNDSPQARAQHSGLLKTMSMHSAAYPRPMRLPTSSQASYDTI